VNVVGIDHVQLAMPPGREDEARAFYQGVLGLAEQPKPARLAARGGCWFAGGGVRIHLGVEESFQPARKAHPALVVADLRAALDEAGIGFIEDDLDGVFRVYVHDPFGNRLELLDAG
jgi:catechol 2,3-dioxygenase-like lactoylglutathione lyase family enzyme